jgi:hypothetical protein
MIDLITRLLAVLHSKEVCMFLKKFYECKPERCHLCDCIRPPSK